MNSRLVGRVGEDAAARYLERQGYQVVERNFYTRYSELDLICRQGSELVFVEVKARTSYAYGRPEESVTPAKLQKLRKGIALYLAERNPRCQRIRMDAVVVDLVPGTLDVQDIRHYQNIS